MKDFTLEGGQALLWLIREFCDPAEHSVVSGRDDEASAGSRDAMCTLKTNVLGLEVVFVCRVDRAVDRNRFAYGVLASVLRRGDRGSRTCEDGPVNLEIRRDLDKTNIGRELVASLDQQDISRDELVGKEGDLLSVAYYKAVFREQVLDRVHDTRRRPVLPHVKCSLDEEHSKQDDSQGKVRRRRGLSQGSPRDKDQNCGHKEDCTEPLEEVTDYLLSIVRRGWRRGVLSIATDASFDLIWGETFDEGGTEASDDFVDVVGVPLEFGEIWEQQVRQQCHDTSQGLYFAPAAASFFVLARLFFWL